MVSGARGAVGGMQVVRKTSRALGSEASITALHERREVAERAIDAAVAELRRIDQIMSIYRAESQVSILNRTGILSNPDQRLLEVLQAAQEISQQTGGAFDVTVQPLWEVYAAAAREEKLPESVLVEAAVRKVNWKNLQILADRVELKPMGTAITLNGIAQGYAADRVVAVLRQHGIEHAMVNTGELGALGRREDGMPWNVAIQHPRRADAYVALAKLDGRYMATSGDYETSFTDDHAYNHIFDPATGKSPVTFSSVTVVAETGMAADALSTAIFVLGYEKGLKLLGNTKGAEGLFVLKDGRVVATAGFPQA